VLEECGHVPQVELPERTNKLVREHIRTAARGEEEVVARNVILRALRRAG
jgi:hypothetical protein